MKKQLFVLLGFFVIPTLLLATTPDLSEAYHGEVLFQKKKSYADLLLHSLPDQSGNYLGLLILSGSESLKPTSIAPYLLQSTQKNRYKMTSMIVTSDGSIGFDRRGRQPSLILTLLNGHFGKNQPSFEIKSVHDPNQSTPFSAKFDGTKESRLQWIAFKAGMYNPYYPKTGQKNESVLISDLSEEFQASFNANMSNLSGTFLLQEHQPSMYALMEEMYTRTDELLNPIPTHIIFFIQYKTNFFIILRAPTITNELHVLKWIPGEK